MFDVISFGSAIADVILKVKGFNRGEKIEAEKMGIFSGGGGTNTAVCFSRLGLKTALVCRFGKDLFGDLLLSDLKKEKVDLDFLVRFDKETDLSVILVAPDGSRTILVCRGKTFLTEKDIDFGQIKQTKWFYLASLEGNVDLAEKLINFALRNNIKVAWNPGKRELKNKKKTLQVSQNTEVFSVNKQEAEELLDLSFKAKNFWQKARKISKNFVIITDGRKGAYILNSLTNLNNLNSDVPLYLPTKNGKVVDETGAGDAFSATFTAGLIKGMDYKKAFSLAMKNAGSVVRYFGAKQGLLKFYSSI